MRLMATDTRLVAGTGLEAGTRLTVFQSWLPMVALVVGGTVGWVGVATIGILTSDRIYINIK